MVFLLNIYACLCVAVPVLRTATHRQAQTGYAQKKYPRNINHMPAVIFFASLDLEQKPLVMDEH